ncbi:MAG: hypothetical protein OEU36_26145, partial [Gammaproteobacteria bacterium]|nr:hypothetical protein [Gammaproteobacteria bacterium]
MSDLPDRRIPNLYSFRRTIKQSAAFILACAALVPASVPAAEFILVQAGKLLAVPGQAPQSNKTIVVSAE